jgi:hypothetical protein
MTDGIFLQAWNEIMEDAQEAEQCVVSMYSIEPYYGGPEEGGWWGNLLILKEFVRCTTRDAAEKLQEKIQERCSELNLDARKADGEHCLRQIERADARGEDIDDYGYDGPSSYNVIIEKFPGENQVTERSHYE